MKWSWNRRQQLLGYLFIAPNLLGIIFLFLIPSIFSLILMMTDYHFTQSFHLHFIGFANFSKLFGEDLFYQSLSNTFIFLLSVPVTIILAFVIALILNQSVYWKNLLRTMYFLPYITSSVAVGFVWMLLLSPKEGPVNSFLHAIGIEHTPGWFSSTHSAIYGIDIIWIWNLIGYNMIIFLAALQGISTELLEAAKIDGARRWHAIRYIILPLVSPTTFFLLITGFIFAVKSFGLIQAVTGGGPGGSTTVLSLFAYQAAFRYYEMGYASAVSWVLFMFIFIITLFQWYGQKKWVHY